MKRLFAILVAVAVAMCSCSKIFDTSVLERNIVELKDRVTALEEQCKQMNTNISSLQTIVTALQNNDYVTGVAPITQNGVEIGYTISFSKSGIITIYHGEDGKDGANGADGKDGTNGTDGKDGVNGADGKDGVTPIIGVKQDTDGIYYWTVNGEWLLDEVGNKVKAVGTDGKDGTNGADGADGKDGVDGTNGTDGKDGVNGTNGTDGITPQLKIENDYWYISYDNGVSWTQIGKATGEDGQDGANGADGAAGKDGDSFFQSIDTSNSDYIIFTLADGTEIKLPTWYAFEQLKTLCNQMNTNLESLQTVVAAMQEGDYITSCTPLMENGKQIGYTIVFAKMGSIVIYHGKDGVNGSDGADGSDGSDGSDGAVVVPTIGIKQDTNGIYYWTLDGQWLLDSEGYKVRASPTDGVNGEDGKDGANGSDGADGKDGITPQLKIEEGYWYVSYNNGESWELLGKATGEDGANGTDGKDGDSFFQSVTQDENNVIFTLADGTVITVPKSSSYLFNKLQSVSYVPKFSDGKATVYYSAANNSQVEMDFEVSPKDAATDIAAQWETILFLKAVNTQTRAVTYIDMPILGCTADAQHGVITVTASGKNLAENFFSGEQTVSTRLGISDGNTNITSEFIPLVAQYKQPNNEILYTSTDGNIVEPYDKTVFGANIVSNTYENGKGIITFDGEVTKIGYGAFGYCSSLTNITIPDNVTEIGYNAFHYCSGLTSVTIPDSVTSIGDYAFCHCSGLTSVTIPDSVTEIGDYAFQSCRSLTSITIPDSVTQIDINPFDSCANLAEFKGKFASEDCRCLIVDGILNSFAPAGLTEYTIPDSVTEIGNHAFFYCFGLTSVTIPDSVTKIRNGAFYSCDGLTSITIPDSVTSIESNPFQSCNNLSEFKGKFAAEDGRCLVIDGVLNSFAPAGITTYNIPDSVTKIGDSAFLGCTGLTSVTIPDSVTEVSCYAFCDCSGLTSITFPNSVTKIGDSAFLGCTGLTSVTIPNSVTEIGGYAFHNCFGLTSITFPNSVTEIGGYAFHNCFGLTSIFCERTTPPTANFEGYSSWYAFDDNAADRKIYVPTESVDAYKSADGWKEYADAIVADPNIQPNNEIWYTSTDGNIVEPYKTDVFGANIVSNTYENGKGVILFNGNITEIGESAFAACDNLISITIPNGVTAIGNFAFQSCDNLTGITIPNSVKAIRSYAFTHCKGMQRVTIGEGVETIEHQVFDNCTNLIKFNGKYASEDGRCLIIDGVLNSFASAELSEYTISDYVTEIYYSAFSSSDPLTKVVIPDSVEKIGWCAFTACYNLVEVYCRATIPPTIDKFHDTSWNAFSDNATNRKIYVPRASVDAYKSADGWSDYADAIEPYDFSAVSE